MSTHADSAESGARGMHSGSGGEVGYNSGYIGGVPAYPPLIGGEVGGAVAAYASGVPMPSTGHC